MIVKLTKEWNVYQTNNNVDGHSALSASNGMCCMGLCAWQVFDYSREYLHGKLTPDEVEDGSEYGDLHEIEMADGITVNERLCHINDDWSPYKVKQWKREYNKNPPTEGLSIMEKIEKITEIYAKIGIDVVVDDDVLALAKTGI